MVCWRQSRPVTVAWPPLVRGPAAKEDEQARQRPLRLQERKYMATGTLRAVLAGFGVFVAIAAVLAFGGGSAVATTCTDPPTNLQQPWISGSPFDDATLT